MIRHFQEIMDEVIKAPSKVIAVAAAQDEDVLQAVAEAKNLNIADAVLVGDREEILEVCSKIGADAAQFQILDVKDKKEAARKAVGLVGTGQADILMKGILGTADILRAVLDKEIGLRKGNLLSHVAIIEIQGYDRLLFMTDGGMNIAPDLKQKVELVQNAAELARALGIEKPKVAPLAALELVNPDMPATVEAALLSQMAKRGQIKDVEIDGPLALDNAISVEAAKHKGIESSVAGHADILLAPDIEAGNIFYKSLAYFTDAKLAGTIVGAQKPIILTSRADTAETKLRSIALACYIA